MSLRANPVAVGVFVVGALALVVAGLIAFGGGYLFSDRRTFILYFPESVRGLNEGAPVLLRGVRVGSVVGIDVELDPEQRAFRIPVLIEIDPDHIHFVDNGSTAPDDKLPELLIARGLRGQLQLESFVTGQLLVDLDLRPESAARLVDVETPYPQIPTVPSGLERLSQTFGEIPLDEVMRKALSTLEGIERFVNAPELVSSLQSLEKTLDRTHEFIGNIDQRMAGTGRDFDRTLRQTRDLLSNLDRQVEPLMESLQATSLTGRETLEGMQEFIGGLEGITGEDAEIRYRLVEVLREASLAARSLRSLADYLEENPDALLRGRRGGETE